MVELTKKPFHLNAAQCRWVGEILESLSLEEKIGQMFCIIGLANEDGELLDLYREIPYGGLMHRPGKAAVLRKRNAFLQRNVKVPLLVAANLEFGGAGAALEGTNYGTQMQVAATGDVENAYHLGAISAREAASIGVNYGFAPVVDIDLNWRNPITNTRTYGSDADIVLAMGLAYARGAMENGIAISPKHFPGDGVDERDQHIVASVNSLSCEAWDATYGRVYRALVEAGAQTIMAGHILQPAHTRRIHPSIAEEDIRPASASRELITGLLREEIGFNGVVITDAINMAGFCCTLSRKALLVESVNAGCDMLLFGRNLQEDYAHVLQAARDGEISQERVEGAVTRILALKASLGLHLRGNDDTDTGIPEVLGCAAHAEMARACAERAATLVKDTQGLLPVTPQTHPRIWLFILGDEPGFTGGTQCRGMVIRLLEEAGFEVDCFDEANATLTDTQVPIQTLQAKYDLILYVANVINASNRTVSRIAWSPPVAVNAPYFVRDIPTAFISLGNPYHFVDVPMIRTIINGYNASETVFAAILDRMMGKGVFAGQSPVDPFCGMWGGSL